MAQGKDMSAVVHYKYPSRLRSWLRRIGLDKTVWQYKVIKFEEVKKG